MALRSSGRKFSFNILSDSSSVEEDECLLYQSNTDPIEKVSGSPEKPNRKKKRHRKKKLPESYSMIPEDPITDSGFTDSNSAVQNGNVFLENRSSFVGGGSVVCTVSDVTEVAECQSVFNNSGILFSVETSPVKYFMDEMYKGNSLRSTTTLGSEKERERVYDTIFRLPWRCELLIDVGFFVCLDSFLSLLTIMPTRILMTLWRLLSARQFKKPSAAELSDVGCFLVLASGVALLERTDISLIYMIRGQGTIKLYVVYNVLENALMVFICEMLIDIIKHSFLAKFNDIKPIAYSEFLEELCNQTLNTQTEDKKKNLTFVPLAPACVVIRVLTPVYAAHLPYSPLPWRFFWILLLSAMTYVMLTSLKVMIGMALQKHATCGCWMKNDFLMAANGGSLGHILNLAAGFRNADS
ncbi:hypothetical protein GH714_042027 [Hevea brasiliensis]|uniref:Protein POLLEN DEFECTIVE IN GUIDANCE 1 n=1 Tax=Hevea brasiliensis TaxID=3981 RepID=A0A6A6MWI6_HEVBR|nr:hypothetical protein GH714_042027 [Hevea brasiliensis]